MPDKFQKFSPELREVFFLAQEEAMRFNHNYIGTEHLLLGLVREGDSVAAHVLDELGVELSNVRSALELMVGRGDGLVVGGAGLTPCAKKVIELAMDEARRMQSNQIGTEHLLLGLVREGEGIAAGILETLGVSLVKVRAAVFTALDTPDPNPPSTTAIPSALQAGGLTEIKRGQFLYGLTLPPEIVAKMAQVMRRLNRSMDDLIIEAITAKWLQNPDENAPETELPPPQNDPRVQP